MLKILEGFHHRAAQRITRMTAKLGAGGEWYYPSVVEAMEAVGIHPIGVYIMIQQSIIAERVDCRPIYELCMDAEKMPGMSWSVQWWYQDALNESEE